MEKITLTLSAKGARRLRKRTGAASTSEAVKMALWPLLHEKNPSPAKGDRLHPETLRAALDHEAGRVEYFDDVREMHSTLIKRAAKTARKAA